MMAASLYSSLTSDDITLIIHVTIYPFESELAELVALFLRQTRILPGIRSNGLMPPISRSTLR